jgi:hypothetical protein
LRIKQAVLLVSGAINFRVSKICRERGRKF